jgi:hypothetical protein
MAPIANGSWGGGRGRVEEQKCMKIMFLENPLES